MTASWVRTRTLTCDDVCELPGTTGFSAAPPVTRRYRVEELVALYGAGSPTIPSFRDRCRARPLARSADNSGFLRTSRMPAARSPRDSTSPRWPVIRTTGRSGRISCSARRELGSGHLGHDLVGQHQIEAIRVGAKRRQCSRALIEADRLVADCGQHLLAKQDERSFIVDQEDRLALPERQGRLAAVIVCRRRFGLPEIGLEAAAGARACCVRSWRHRDRRRCRGPWRARARFRCRPPWS